MSAALHVDLRSAVPPYEQIRAQVAGHVAAGALRPGDRLPTVRDLAADLGVAPGTVQRAYRELEATGVVISRRRHGTSVAPGAPRPASAADGALRTDDAADAPDDVRSAAHSLARAALAAGLADGDVLDLVRGTLAAARDRSRARSLSPG